MMYPPTPQLSEGLNYIHSCSMIHGDRKGVRDDSRSCPTSMLTPSQSNLVDATGHACIVDFGLATAAQDLSPAWSASATHGQNTR